ncbi:DNA-deoxyinosine glycosylase [Sphingobium sp. SCG-1]|uniref:DNA-deoxyinosine glycosylase n=1 Tax=Sphingobium sp. SCG-1 TaxID=2072936 RepID=UPI000CD6A692|nr:DNA-deoxyinosine glycosylase [Sphingobium sp. SCG-1]AUW57307.1 DNA-deoxyinosine glycosylase [Sphingobium sp. SCG-1]
MSNADDLKRGLPPIVDADTRLLILGSLPGDKSLQASQYYAHPRNHFWNLVGGVIDVPLRALDYSDRLATLRQHRIGLWDVVASASRRGSLDAAMRDIEPNMLVDFVGTLPNLAAVAFNGKTAFMQGVKALAPVKELALIPLPSSSPAHAVDLSVKYAAWTALREVLRS